MLLSATLLGAQDVKEAAKQQAAIERAARDGVGPCRGATVPDSALLSTVVAKPDAKPRRLPVGPGVTVDQGAFRLATPDDQFHNMEGHPRRVGVMAVIDTTGQVVPGTVAITSSSSGELAQAVCEAFPGMKFKPAKKGNALVLAQYEEKLEFLGTGARTTMRGAKDESSVR
jgi:hypothetical protein